MASVNDSEQAIKEVTTSAPLHPSNEPIPTVPEPIQQAPLDNLPQPVQQVPVDGQAFLAKLQRKGMPLQLSNVVLVAWLMLLHNEAEMDKTT